MMKILRFAGELGVRTWLRTAPAVVALCSGACDSGSEDEEPSECQHEIVTSWWSEDEEAGITFYPGHHFSYISSVHACGADGTYSCPNEPSGPLTISVDTPGGDCFANSTAECTYRVSSDPVVLILDCGNGGIWFDEPT